MKTSDIIKPIRPHLNHRALPLAALALATAFGLNSAQAYSIVWDTAKNTTADTDVVATGTGTTFVRAVAGSPLGEGYGATVNGVVFTSYPSTPSDEYSWNGTQYNKLTWGTGTGAGLWTDSLAKTNTDNWGLWYGNGYFAYIPPSGLSGVYTQALAGVRYSGVDDTMTLGGLTVGQSYLVQLWTCDARGSNNGMSPQTMYLDDNPSTAMLTDRGYSGDPGQYIIGRFVAASTEQTFKLTGSVLVNAYQLRTIDSPLPTEPVVTITSPADAATVLATFTVTATGGDYDGSITSVTLSYSADAGSTWHELGAGTGLPYSYTWSDAPPGDYQFKAVAVDNATHETTSAVVHITVADNAPAVAITSPAAAAPVPPDFIIAATATDDGAITHVEFYDDDGVTLLGTAYTSPYTCMVTGAGLGTHKLTAKAFDNGGNSTISAKVTVTVVPSVAITWDPAQKIKNIYECGDPPNYYDSAHVAVSEAEISLEGTPVRAVACGTATGSVTVNTVAFEYVFKTGVDAYNSYNGYDPHYKGCTTGVDTFYSNIASDWGINQNGPNTYNQWGSCPSTAYTTLLGGGMQAGNNTVPLTLTLGNLTPGQRYLVQLWCNESRWGSHALQTVDGVSTMDACVDPWVSGLGQYLIGRFTAAGTSQTISILGGSELINAYQLRAISGATDSGYNAWATIKYGLTDGAAARGADPDGDGFTNLQEFLFGTSPVAANGTLVTNDTVGGDLVLHWLQRASGSGYVLQESITMGAGEWSTSAIVPVLDDQSGVPAGYERYKAIIPIGVGHKFFRVEGTEN